MHFPHDVSTLRRAARVLLVTGPLLVWGPAACRTSEPEVWQTVLRLTDELERPRPASAPARCTIADESRPALGCPVRRNVASETRPWPEGDVLEIRTRLPAELAQGKVVLEPSVLASELDGWRGLPAIVLEGQHPGATLSLPIPADLGRSRSGEIRVRVAGLAIDDRPKTFRTREVEVPEQAALRVGLAIDRVAAELGAAPTEFVVRAHGDFGTRELLREVVRPEEGRERWIDRRVDLGSLGGRTARFEFTARSRPPRDGEEPGVNLPIWGNPRILAARPRGGERNVVLVSLDTLRGDFVGADYEGRRLTPALDRRADQGVWFGQAVAAYPSTSASHMTLFTSTYPAEHKVLHAKNVLPPETSTLPEILAGHAYETAAFTENGMLAAAAGFERGFDDYYENRGLSMWDARGDIEQTLDRGLRWLGHHRDEKFFLFLHTYQVHTPYEPPPEYDVFEGAPRDGEKPHVARMRNLYAGEVAYTDHVIRRLFETLERLGVADETLVVVTADHGDEFGEHGQLGHSRGVYDEVLRVPLLFWAPGLVPAGGDVGEQVSLIDLAPTILDLVGVPPAPGLRGESLAPAILDGDPVGDELRFAEGPALKHRDGRIFSARTGRYKWIGREHAADPIEIYDLEADPGETKNLAGDPELRARGRALLDVYRQIDSSSASPAREREVDPETKKKLEALGYVD